MSGVPTLHNIKERRPDWAALAIAIALVLIACVIFWDSARLASVTGYSPVGPATVPYAIAFCLVGLALWTAIEAGAVIFLNGTNRKSPRSYGSSPALPRRCCC